MCTSQSSVTKIEPSATAAGLLGILSSFAVLGYNGEIFVPERDACKNR